MLMAKASETHVTCWVDKSLKQKVSQKILKSEDSLLLKECMAAGLVLVLSKNETQIRNIIKNFRKGGVK